MVTHTHYTHTHTHTHTHTQREGWCQTVAGVKKYLRIAVPGRIVNQWKCDLASCV